MSKCYNTSISATLFYLNVPLTDMFIHKSLVCDIPACKAIYWSHVWQRSVGPRGNIPCIKPMTKWLPHFLRSNAVNFRRQNLYNSFLKSFPRVYKKVGRINGKKYTRWLISRELGHSKRIWPKITRWWVEVVIHVIRYFFILLPSIVFQP